VRTITTARSTPTPHNDNCQSLLIDDWASQSRLTFLYYNALLQPSADDNTMSSVVVNNDNTVTLTPKDENSYWYSQFPCVDARDWFGGISMKIKAPSGTQFSIELASSRSCGSSNSLTKQSFSSRELGWTFDGSFKSFNLPLRLFDEIDQSKLAHIFITGLNRAVSLSPIGFYCGDRPSDFPSPPHIVNAQNQYTVSTPSGNAGTLLIDKFDNEDRNALGQWHGCEEDCVKSSFRNSQVTLQTNDSDLSWYVAFADKCADITDYKDSYLHISYTGSNKFTIALQQANPTCDSKLKPWPETWDSVEAARYATSTDIYIPLSHFKVELSRVTNIAFKGFYTTASTTLKRIELVDSVPSGFKMPNKLPTGQLVFTCKRPNSFAFAIDDGDPAMAQEVMEIVRSENIKVTFFTVGLPLEDKSNNLSAVYKDMQARGHQIALHSYTHPKMEGLPDYAAIDWEYNNDIAAVQRTFENMHTPYFRPPFGTEGARMRQRLAVALNVTDPYLVMWSVDVEDWLWGTSNTPEKQLDAFKRDLARGGNLVVMHYLYPNTVRYLRQFIRLAKETGRQLMRVDQCMMDPRAPPLDGQPDTRPPPSRPSTSTRGPVRTTARPTARPTTRPVGDTPINRRPGAGSGGDDDEDPGYTDWDD
jgi:peptidoglycan/xylan/chitin deacetylase (PgdA/CDA1 family)